MRMIVHSSRMQCMKMNRTFQSFCLKNIPCFEKAKNLVAIVNGSAK